MAWLMKLVRLAQCRYAKIAIRGCVDVVVGRRVRIKSAPNRAITAPSRVSIRLSNFDPLLLL